jgi:hypothetical protein
VTAAAAFIAWLGAALIVLSDGRRGLALGLALTAVAFGALAWANGEPLGATALLAGGAVAAVQRLRSGTDDWRLMPPGSTPRLILAVAAGVIALWVAVSVTSGAGASRRFALLAVLGLIGARLLTGRDPTVALTAVAAMALALAAASGLAGVTPGAAPYIAAALIAAGASLLRPTESHVA